MFFFLIVVWIYRNEFIFCFVRQSFYAVFFFINLFLKISLQQTTILYCLLTHRNFHFKIKQKQKYVSVFLTTTQIVYFLHSDWLFIITCYSISFYSINRLYIYVYIHNLLYKYKYTKIHCLYNIQHSMYYILIQMQYTARMSVVCLKNLYIIA